MRDKAGLLLPERRIGLSAHDFQQAIGAPEVWLTRATRSDDAETVPSPARNGKRLKYCGTPSATFCSRFSKVSSVILPTPTVLSTKSSIARSVLRRLINEVPENTPMGLVAYGHRKRSDCADVETILPLSLHKSGTLQGHIDGLTPTGKRACEAGANLILSRPNLEVSPHE